MHILSSKLALYLLSVSLFVGISSAGASEKEELALIIKQLTQVKASLLRSEIVSGTEQTDRYHFNYQIAQRDVNQIMQGIERYLSPSRSQPRSLDFPAITGDYQQDGISNE